MRVVLPSPPYPAQSFEAGSRYGMPSAAQPGRVFHDKAEDIWYEDTGITWEVIADIDIWLATHSTDD